MHTFISALYFISAYHMYLYVTNTWYYAHRFFYGYVYMCIYLHAYSLVYIASMASRPRKRKREPLSAGFNPWHQPLCFDQEGRFLGGLGMTWYPQKDEEKRWEEFFGGLGERFLWIKTWCRYYSFWEQPDMKEQRLTVIAEGAKLQTCTYILFWSFLTPCLVAEVFSTRRYNTRIYIYIYTFKLRLAPLDHVRCPTQQYIDIGQASQGIFHIAWREWVEDVGGMKFTYIVLLSMKIQALGW